MIKFILGLVIGVFFGALLFSVMDAASSADDKEEERMRKNK